MVIYTDAATSTRIVASLDIDVKDFWIRREFRNIWAEVPDPKWGYTFILTTYIYVLEILAILATVSLDADYLRGRHVAFILITPTAGTP